MLSFTHLASSEDLAWMEESKYKILGVLRGSTGWEGMFCISA